MSSRGPTSPGAAWLSTSGHGRRVRESSGVSCEEMAAAIGVETGVLVQWEAGLLDPVGVEAVDWARFVHVLELHGERPPLADTPPHQT